MKRHPVVITISLLLLVGGVCTGEEKEMPMREEMSIEGAIQDWIKNGGKLREKLRSNEERQVRTKAEADAICSALSLLRKEPERNGKEVIWAPLHTLANLFQQIETKEAAEALKANGLPLLRLWVTDYLDGKGGDEGDLLFILKILAMYRQREDVSLIARAARKPLNPDGSMWTVVFNQFANDHPFANEMVDALRDPLPSQFLLVAYLDLANLLSLEGKLAKHPFDSEAGKKCLEAFLRSTDPGKFSYAHSTAASLPFLGKALRDELMKVALEHPDSGVRMEAAWAQVKSGDQAGLDTLAKCCLDPNQSYFAQQYLKELEHPEKIPEAALKPEFQAVAEMSTWLAHPSEYGKAPDKIELLDSRELYWPPTQDTRRMYLVKYTYKGEKEGEKEAEPEVCVGMVGSITFSLFDTAKADLPIEDLYGIYCSWEMRVKKDARAPEEISAKAGRAFLAEKNKGF